MSGELSVMIVGSGAREHAISLAYERSPQVSKIIVAPGNDFIGFNREKEVLTAGDCSLKDPNSILKIARAYSPDIIDVAQDDALATGTVDLLQKHGFSVFGPSRDASRIEWDKRWSREFMVRQEIPVPEFQYFQDENSAIEYVKEQFIANPDRIFYVKAASLCAGKGALKSSSLDEAVKNILLMKTLPDGAGETFLVEEGLVGEEFSYYAIVDGMSYKLVKSAQDNKTVFNFDEGDQTGGMGAIAPAMVTDSLSSVIERELIAKAVNGMAKEGIPFRGILYLGGIVVDGSPINIEYNARWGDPECQVVLPAIQNDYVDIVTASINGQLNNAELVQDAKSRVCVVGSAKGYPNDYSASKGKRIFGLEDAMNLEGITVLGAAITVEDGKFYANGGRLFSIVAEGSNVIEARQQAYVAMAMITIEGNNLHYRTDIGWRDIDRILRV